MAEIQDNKIVTYDDISTKLNEHQSDSNECPPKEDIVSTYVTVSKEPYGTELVPYADNQCVQYKDIVLGLVDITIQQSAGGTISVVYDGTTYTSGTFKALAGRDLQIKTTYHVTDNNYKILWWDGNTDQTRTWTVTGPTVIRADYYQFNTNTSTAVKSYDANTFTLNITSLKNTVATTYQVDIPNWLTTTKNNSNVVFNLTANADLDDRAHTIVYTQDVSGLTGQFVLTQGGRRTFVKWGNSADITGVTKEGTTYSRPLVYSSTYSTTTGYYNKQALVTSTAAWLTYSDPTITVAKNEYAAIEEGTLTITNNGIEGVVPQGDIDILVQRLGRTRTVKWNSTSTWSPSNTANTTTRAITYSGDYIAGKFEPVARVSSNQDWCHVSLSGTTVTISVDTNIIGCSQPSRSATISLLVGGEGQEGLSISGSSTFTVTQALWQTNCSFRTNTTSLAWGTAGGTSKVTVTNSDGSTTADWELDLTDLNERYTVTKDSDTQITVTAANSISSTALNSSFKIRQLGCCSNVITINLSTAAWAKTKNSTLTISPTSWTPSKYGESTTFSATSYIDIYTEGTNGTYVRNYPDVNWSTTGSGFSVSPSTGTSVTVRATDNSDGDYRTGSVAISNGYKSTSASISQDGASYEFRFVHSVSLGCEAGSSDWSEVRSTKNGNSHPWSISTDTASGWTASPSSGSNGTRITITNRNCNNGGDDYIVITQNNSGLTDTLSWTNDSGCCCAGYYSYTVNTGTPGATVKFGSYTTITADSSGKAVYTSCGSVGCITVTVSKSGYTSQSKSVCADGSWTISGGLVPECSVAYYDATPKSASFTAAGGTKNLQYRTWCRCGDGTASWIRNTDTWVEGTSNVQWLTNVYGDGAGYNDPSLYPGYGNLEVTAPINKATSDRSGYFTFYNRTTCGTSGLRSQSFRIDVSQSANSYSFNLGETVSCATVWDCTISAAGTGLTGTSYWCVCQDLTGSTNWPKYTVSKSASWIYTNITEGANGTHLVVGATGANTSTSSRSGTVTLTQQESNKQCTIRVNQAGQTVTPPSLPLIDMRVHNTSDIPLYGVKVRIGGNLVSVGSRILPGQSELYSFTVQNPNTVYEFTIWAQKQEISSTVQMHHSPKSFTSPAMDGDITINVTCFP